MIKIVTIQKLHLQSSMILLRFLLLLFDSVVCSGCDHAYCVFVAAVVVLKHFSNDKHGCFNGSSLQRMPNKMLIHTDSHVLHGSVEMNGSKASCKNQQQPTVEAHLQCFTS